MQRIFVTIVLIALLLGIADASCPKVGDTVKIVVQQGLSPTTFEGQISGIDLGLICFDNATGQITSGGRTTNYTFEKLCIGIGQISMLVIEKEATKAA